MSMDFVALTRERPDPAAMLTGTTGPRGPLDVRTGPDGVHLHEPDGPFLVSVEAPVFVQVEGEVERLLGVRMPGPVWWVDIRAAVEPKQAVTLAKAIGEEFVRRHGGTLWTGGRQ